MTKRVHTAISLYPEDIKKLDELAEAAGINRSNFIRVLIRNEYASKEGKLVTTHNAQYEGEKTSDESEGPNVEDELGAFSTKKLPKLSIYVKWQLYWDEKYQRKIWIRVAPLWEFYIEEMMNYFNKSHRFTTINETMHNYETGNVQRINRRNYEID